MWTKERIIQLNKLICEATGKPHAIRNHNPLDSIEAVNESSGAPEWRDANVALVVIEQHPFVDGNKSTGLCVAICNNLKNI